MRRTTVRRPIRLTESKLRQIIRSIIKENQDISSSEDLDYLSGMGIYSIEDAISHAMSQDTQLSNESINRLMFRVIKESASDDQKLMNAANLINNQIKNDSPENLERAADKLSELKHEKNPSKRLKIVGAALAVLGITAVFAPLVLFIITGFAGAGSAAGGAALAALGKMGGIGTLISMVVGKTSAEIGFDMARRG